jgi:hypothetical protein
MGTSVGYELFESVEVEISRAVATVRLLTTERVAVLSAQGSQAELHFDLGRALARLREDDAVRVVTSLASTTAHRGFCQLRPTQRATGSIPSRSTFRIGCGRGFRVCG